ncbi:hypothetical protein WN66_00849 [Saccharomyces cerevisiae]|nr:hypothetical protein WN66_00849 [Saccharomyces cerevisiae]
MQVVSILQVRPPFFPQIHFLLFFFCFFVSKSRVASQRGTHFLVRICFEPPLQGCRMGKLCRPHLNHLLYLCYTAYFSNISWLSVSKSTSRNRVHKYIPYKSTELRSVAN